MKDGPIKEHKRHIVPLCCQHVQTRNKLRDAALPDARFVAGGRCARGRGAARVRPSRGENRNVESAPIRKKPCAAARPFSTACDKVVDLWARASCAKCASFCSVFLQRFCSVRQDPIPRAAARGRSRTGARLRSCRRPMFRGGSPAAASYQRPGRKPLPPVTHGPAGPWRSCPPAPRLGSKSSPAGEQRSSGSPAGPWRQGLVRPRARVRDIRPGRSLAPSGSWPERLG